MFGCPKRPVGCESGALGVAVSEAPDLGLRLCGADKRVVTRDGSVSVQPDDGPAVFGQVLRVLGGAAVSYGHKQMPAWAFEDAAAEVPACAAVFSHFKQIAGLGELEASGGEDCNG